MLDLRGARGRRFGGIGAAAPAPSLLLEASPAEGLYVTGPSGDRVLEFARRYTSCYGLRSGARVHMHRDIPAHAGLGSGTQLALATARALAELYGLPTDPIALTRAVGRAQRSAIGTWVFADGGFVLEGGRREGVDRPAPLLARFRFPAGWRCVVAVPHDTTGMSGEAEVTAFSNLPLPAAHEVELVAHLVLMELLPALADGELDSFGRALTEIQSINGRWFAPAQGGAFAAGTSAELVRAMREWGAAGVGQSSWGPAVYGIVEGDPAAETLAARVRQALGARGAVFAGQFPEQGARVWRAPVMVAACD